MKIIAVIGDSHTWGQGVGGDYHLDPPIACGDLRPLPFHYPLYVNLLRDAVNLATNSHALIVDDGICQATGRTEGQLTVVETGTSLTWNSSFDFARIFFRAEAEAAEVTVTLDGEVADVISLQNPTPLTEAPHTDGSVEICHLFPKNDGEHHEVTLTVTKGSRVLICRWEEYRGEYAVVNCGVGSGATVTYTNRYFDRYVTPIKPYAVLFEGCTINNWLQTPTVEDYADQLRLMAEKIRALTPRQLWHTVSPVWGNRINGQGIDYADYVEAMRKVAAELDIPMVDCHAYMAKELAAVREELCYPLLFSDGWHPNGTGHYMYAKTIFPVLRNML